MRSPLGQENLSSSSLEGMKRPVRSFKSFIKTVPPHPTSQDKHSPPFTPLETTQSSSPSTPRPSSLKKSSSPESWSAPDNWYDTKDSPQIPLNREFSPLLPEPSPHTSDMALQSPTYPVAAPLSSPTSGLRPIIERKVSHDLAPPSSPPKSPLPSPPLWTLNGRTTENPLVSSNVARSSNRSPGPTIKKYAQESDPRFRTTSPPSSTNTSIISNASTKEKAFASLGIDSTMHQTAVLHNSSLKYARSQTTESDRADDQRGRGKRLMLVNQGNPLTDDGWEDLEMDDKTRMLSFSQDYHDLLVDQYRELEVKDHADVPDRKPKVPPKDRELVPKPLSWRKSTSGVPSPQNASPRTQSPGNSHSHTSATDLKESKLKIIPAWVPRRLSVGAVRHLSTGEPSKNHHTATRSKQIPEAEVDKSLKNELRLSMFIPSSKPLRFRKKSRDHTTKSSPSAKASSPNTSPSKTTPLLRLPGGLAIVRQVPSTTSNQSSADFPKHSSDSPSNSHTHSHRTSYSLPKRNPNNHRSSLTTHNRHSHSPGTASSTTTTTNNNNTSRHSTASSTYSQSSYTSYPPALAISAPYAIPPPPPPPPPPSIPYEAPLSPEAWTRLKTNAPPSDSPSPSRSQSPGGHHHRPFFPSPSSSSSSWHTYYAHARPHRSEFVPGFVAKARDARRLHHKQQRQERLKKSIKVLGPTDPSVVSGYVRDGTGSSGEFGKDGWDEAGSGVGGEGEDDGEEVVGEGVRNV
ncbi:hypothetical protein DM02DRAFT_648296 [Periconia macrospinosa]|uniref:Uncharacterized protein n=1 Tax=Periconia macrospinosa TaxID=97972 RepID=A0A2V1EDX6_9PLEO|nr:hypothetical protein DM02DRAFT_648296 [Periconia macrospinosa]